MEDIIKDYLWYEYEGKIIHETWNKCISKKGDNDRQKFLVDKIFRKEDLKRFYQLGHVLCNLSPLFQEEWITEELLLTKYNYILDDSEESYVDLLLLQYHVWLFPSNVIEYKVLLEKLENKSI
jgi:hypothetical protein